MTSLYSKEGKRSPFTIRYWTGFFQVAKNPLYKGTVDFSVVGDHVLEDLSNYLQEKGLTKFKVDSIIENMKKENGGHKGGIWSFQGFDQIKPSSKESGDYWDKKEMLDRAKKVNKILPNTQKAFDEKENGVMAKYKKIREDAMEYAIKRVIGWTNKLYPVDSKAAEALKTDDNRFEEE